MESFLLEELNVICYKGIQFSKSKITCFFWLKLVLCKEETSGIGNNPMLVSALKPSFQGLIFLLSQILSFNLCLQTHYCFLLFWFYLFFAFIWLHWGVSKT
jgi:hypothetical protein